MRKLQLIQNVSDSTGIEVQKVEAVVLATIEEIQKANEKGKAIYIRGFGVFDVVTQKAKKARDIGRNKMIDIPARRKPKFKPYKQFVDRVNK